MTEREQCDAVDSVPVNSGSNNARESVKPGSSKELILFCVLERACKSSYYMAELRSMVKRGILIGSLSGTNFAIRTAKMHGPLTI